MTRVQYAKCGRRDTIGERVIEQERERSCVQNAKQGKRNHGGIGKWQCTAKESKKHSNRERQLKGH